MDELLDIVDPNDRVIGQKPRSVVYQEKSSSFRVINAFLVNNEGRLWIPRRTHTKRIFPLALDASVGGHVESGETYDQAFARELLEELGIQARDVAYECIGTLNPHRHGTSAFMYVYLIRCNDVPQYNKQDFCEYFWLTPDELLTRLEGGDSSKDDLPRMVTLLYKKLVAQPIVNEILL